MAEGSKIVTATATMHSDAIVVCGPIDPAEDRVRAPTLLVEVLYRSTEITAAPQRGVAYRDFEWPEIGASQARTRRGVVRRGRASQPSR